MSERLKSCRCPLHGMNSPYNTPKYICVVAAEKLQDLNDNRSKLRRKRDREEIQEQLKHEN